MLAAALIAALAVAPASLGSLRPVVDPSGSYGESFTLVADLEDGGYLQLTFSLTNLGPGPTKAICRALVVLPGGVVWRESQRFTGSGWSYRTGSAEYLSVGPCLVWSGPSASGARVSLGGGKLKVTAEAPLRELGFPRSAVRVGEDLFESEVLLQGTPARVELALPGEAARAVAARAYADHSRGTVPPKELARRWVRFRALGDEGRLLLLGREGRDGRLDPLWACGDPEHCRRGRSLRIERGGAGDAAFRVLLEGDEPIEIRSESLLYRDAPIEELGLLGKVLAPFFGSPVTYVMRAAAWMDGERVQGILEVELSPEE